MSPGGSSLPSSQGAAPLQPVLLSTHESFPASLPPPKPSPPHSPLTERPQWSRPFLLCPLWWLPPSAPSFPFPFPTPGRSQPLSGTAALCPDAFPPPHLFSHSTAPSVSLSPPPPPTTSAAVVGPDQTNFPRGVSSRSTFHAGQLRRMRDQQNLPYGVTPASPSGNSQGRRGPPGSIFSKFTSKFVRR